MLEFVASILDTLHHHQYLILINKEHLEGDSNDLFILDETLRLQGFFRNCSKTDESGILMAALSNIMC